MAIFDFLKKTINLDKTTKNVDITISSDGEMLDKSVKPIPNTNFLNGQVENSKAVFSLDSRMLNTDRIYQKKGRLSDKDLKDIASYDAIVGLIVNTRSNQVMPFGKKSRGKYERGFILQEKLPIQESNLAPEQKNKEVQYRLALAAQISEYIVSCGTSNKMVVDHVFKGSDSFFKNCSLPDYLSAQTLNLLVFGRCATQIIRNKEGIPIMFRPLPVESIHPVIDQEEISISGGDDVQEQSVLDYAEYKKIEKGRRPAAYVQRMDGKNVAFFTEEEIIMTHLRKQAYEDLDGYPLAPIEQAYYTVTMHFYAQQFMQNMFTKGLASKGIINLKTQEGGVVSPEQTEMFRKTFSNYVARNDNSATIPVISGPIDVSFIELNATSKDMEFVLLYNKVISILCACFQMAPQEIGFGSLDSGAASTNDGKQDDIVQGEERGLRQILECLFGVLNGIVYETFPESQSIFTFSPIGLGQNTKEADLAIYKEELQTSGTFGKIWSDSERIESFPFGGNMPASPVFHSSVAVYMKMSEIRFHFFGDANALNDPTLDFFVDPTRNEMYQAEKYGMTKVNADAAKLGLEMQQQQMAMQEQQMQMNAQPPPEEAPVEEPQPTEEELQESVRAQEKHDMEMSHGQEQHDMDKQSHEMNLEKEASALETEKAAATPNNQASLGILKDLVMNRPKTLKDLYKK